MAASSELSASASRRMDAFTAAVDLVT